eukprot:s233_g19.t1
MLQGEGKCQQQLESLKRLIAGACEEDFQRHATVSEGGCDAEAEGVVSQGDYEIWSKSLVVCRKEKSRIILWSGLGSEVEREDVLWPLRRDGRGCIIHSRREPDTKLGEILNDPQVNVLEACPWSAVKPFWDGASRAFAGSWAARVGAQNYSIILGHDTVERIFDTILYKAELKALAESAQEGLRVDVLFTAAMSLDDQAVVSSILYHRTRLLSPMLDATTWQYGGCPKDELASCAPEHLLEPNSIQLQRLIDKAGEADAHYGGDAGRVARPKARVADGRCQQQLDALTALIAETCQEDTKTGSPVSVGGCQAEAEGVVNLGDFEVWSKSLVACGKDKLVLLPWSGFKEEEREEVLWPLRSRGGCALQTNAPEDTTLAKLLNDERVKVLQDCPWKVTKPFWDGASRNFAGMWAARGRDYSVWVNVVVAMGYDSDPGRTHKTMFNTVFYRSELKALAQASLGALSVTVVFTNSGMKHEKMYDATAVAFERARLLSPLGKAFKRKTEWLISGCSDKKRDLGSCVGRGFFEPGHLFEPDSHWATFSLGVMYWKGWGVQQDHGKAVELFQKSADLGDSVAMFTLAQIYHDGVGVQKNHSRAMELWEQAAGLGHAASMFKLGQMNGGKQNYTKAVEWFQEAADHGWVEAMFNLGYMYYRGVGVQKNNAKALELLPKAADLGNADAMFILGKMYHFGDGVEQNNSKAAQLYSKAADLGTAEAMFSLGRMYYFGEGVQQNYTKAAEWLQEAADLGLLVAMNCLGNMYHEGLGVQKNHNKAAQFYSKAADLGDATGMLYLGHMYYDGEGIDQNDNIAAQLYKKAANLGDAEAMFMLGSMYYNGRGLQVNHTKAAEFYQRAADVGHVQAMLSLGKMYQEGDGVQTDYAKSAELFHNVEALQNLR